MGDNVVVNSGAMKRLRSNDSFPNSIRKTGLLVNVEADPFAKYQFHGTGMGEAYADLKHLLSAGSTRQ